ncbi:hypothetical protein ACSW9I_06120 [Clostridium perfringens]|uniref:hypothetical protein n=1 Tax=Clostridium perfringens TaxID=1502 RepID=UPI0024BC3246|nr:hypothetical protein [Clostridium perfringens]
METKEQLDKQMDLLNEIKNQKYDDEKYKQDLMKNELSALLIPQLNDIANRYINFITKKPAKLLEFNDEFKNILSNINNYVDEEFLSKKIRILDISEVDIIERFFKGDRNLEKEVSYNKFVYFYFKKPVIKIIDIMNNQYSHQLNSEFIRKLLRLKSKVESPIFYTGLEFGIDIDMENAEFDLESMRKVLKEIGLIIIDLYEEIEG